MSEIWKPVIGYEDLYEVSNLGNVRRVAKYNNSTDKPLRPQIVCGYARVSLSKKAKTKNHLVHRLVANAFIGIPDGLCVNHKNGVKTDNLLINLEVVSRSDNELHKHHVLRTGAKPKAKLSFVEAQAIRSLRKDGWTFRKLARQYKVSQGTIGFILNGTTWTS